VARQHTVVNREEGSNYSGGGGGANIGGVSVLLTKGVMLILFVVLLKPLNNATISRKTV